MSEVELCVFVVEFLPEVSADVSEYLFYLVVEVEGEDLHPAG